MRLKNLQGGSTRSRRVTTAAPPARREEEEDFAERFTRCLLEDASGGC